jgi:CDP-diacylglycerol--glycerol-3-phosphate 3-phosphatidyltransferase
VLAWLPNALTGARIGVVPLMVWCAATDREPLFAALLIGSLVGDVVDGILARVLHATTRLGAQLDSVADTLLFLMAIVGAFVFHHEAIDAHPIAFAVVPVAWFGENAVAMLRYGRLSSFHTYLSRAAAVALGVFIASLFVLGLNSPLLYLASGLVLVATAEEFALLYLLPQWTADVRGVWWVVRRPGVRNRG